MPTNQNVHPKGDVATTAKHILFHHLHHLGAMNVLSHWTQVDHIRSEVGVVLFDFCIIQMKTVQMDHLIADRRSCQIQNWSLNLKVYSFILDPPLSSLALSKSPTGVCEAETRQADQTGAPQCRDPKRAEKRECVSVCVCLLVWKVRFQEYASGEANVKQVPVAFIMHKILNFFPLFKKRQYPYWAVNINESEIPSNILVYIR